MTTHVYDIDNSKTYQSELFCIEHNQVCIINFKNGLSDLEDYFKFLDTRVKPGTMSIITDSFERPMIYVQDMEKKE